MHRQHFRSKMVPFGQASPEGLAIAHISDGTGIQAGFCPFVPLGDPIRVTSRLARQTSIA
jgi:hypothetical protein